MEELQMERIWTEYGMDELQQKINNLFPGYSLSLSDLWEQILEGDVFGAIKSLFAQCKDGLFGQVSGLKEILIWLLVLGLISAILSRFVEIFNSNQVSDLCFYFVYLLISTILLNCFTGAAQITISAMESIILFIRLLVPTFLLAVSVAGGAITVSGYSVLLMIIVYLVEHILMAGMISFIYVYVMIAVINGIWAEEKLSFLMELMEKGVGVVLKGALGLITGVSIFQSVITPVLDSVKTNAVHKVVSLIPGIGNGVESVAKLVMGSAVVIKNSIGIVLLLLLLILCVAPLIQVLVIAFLLKLVAAFLSLISDKRITSCTNCLGEGSMMLFRTIGTAMLLFMITISIVATTTNGSF